MLKSLGVYLAGLAADEIVTAVLLVGIFQFMFWFWRWLLGKPMKIQAGKRWAVWVVSFFFLFVLVLLALSATKYLTTQINEIRKGVTSGGGASSIRGSVYRCLMAEMESENRELRGVIAHFNVRLTNPGRASTAWGWTMRMTLPGNQVYEYPALDIRTVQTSIKTLTTSGGASTTNVPPNVLVINAENYLPEILLEKTVGPERGASGWVAFLIQNVPKSEIKSGTKFVLEFEQGDGSRKSIEHVWVPAN